MEVTLCGGDKNGICMAVVMVAAAVMRLINWLWL